MGDLPGLDMSSRRVTVPDRGASTAVVLVVAGEIDMATAPHLRTAVEEIADGVVVIDLTAVLFLGSAGLAVLVALHNRAVLRVVGATRAVLEPLRVSGLDQVLNLHPTVEQAITAG